MKLNRITAGLLTAALAVGVMAVPTFAASAVVEEENCFSESYVMMNVPYSEFYHATGVEGDVDALSSATKNKTRSSLAAGSYHVNADGSEITGVTAPVKVLTPWALDSSKQVTDETSYDITVKQHGENVTTTYSGVEALFENQSYAYYVLDTAPAYYMTAWYNVFSQKWEFGRVEATATTVEGVSVKLKTNGHHTDYEMALSGFDLDTSTNRVYGVVATTSDGAEYGLHHVAHIWRGIKLGFDVDDAYCAAMIGKTITSFTYYTANGVYVLPVNVTIPVIA